jgi:hypothetical protein
MTAMALQQVTIQAFFGTEDRIRRVTRVGKALRRELRHSEPWAERLSRQAPPTVRAKWRLKFAEHVSELRADGELLDTVPAIVTLGARRLLAARGWDHAWPEAGEAKLQGRWMGSVSIGVPERIVCNVDPGLFEQVHGACWHTSLPATEALYSFRRANPGVLMDPDVIAEYNELAADVITPGDVWRDGLDLVLPIAARADIRRELPPRMTGPLAPLPAESR